MRRHALRLVMAGSVVGLGLLGILGTLGGWDTDTKLRPHGTELAVTNPADRGPGTLREAIFAANFATGQVRIVLLVPRVTLRTPLPPVVHRGGVAMVAGDSVAEIDARALTSGPVLDLQAADAIVERIRIRGAGGVGILVREPRARLLGVGLAGCEVGVEQAAGAEGLQVEQATLTENTVGVRLHSGDVGTAIRRSRFRGHREAALWAVAPAGDGAQAGGFTVSHSRFENDRLGVVVGNLTATIQDNEIAGSTVAGIYLTGPGAILRRNRVRGGAGAGVLAALTEGAVITGNEIDDNRTVGIVVSSGRNTLVQDNRIYRNGYGIVVVFGTSRSPSRVADNIVLGHSLDGLFVVGASPILERNRAMNNGAAGLRILDFRPRRGAALSADPLLVDNVLEGNGTDAPVRGVFRAPG